MRYTRWEQRSDTRRTNEILKELALVHCARINALPVREYFFACITSNRILDLCNYDPPYEELSVSDAINVRQICAFYSKRADIDVGIDRRAASVKTFIDAERMCRETNSLLEKRRCGKFLFLPHVESILYSAQRKIASILGPVPRLTDIQPRFGPGATTQVTKRKASHRLKLSMVPACSEDLLPLVRECLEELGPWLHTLYGDDSSESTMVPVEIHNGKLVFVPKSYKTDRSVVVEPSLNTMFQMGIGDYISDRLRKAGVDLHDQTRNQRAALEGSLTGALATLDLSSASDTIAHELVYELLPVDWAIFLDHFRTGSVEYDGSVVKLQKFSSMGNGFTFPLESLIFYALAYACVCEEQQHLVSVYGDDIIVPSDRFGLLCEVLGVCGFVPNKSKSFSSGPFRESCGADYLKGIDIRPCYIKDSMSAGDIFRLHNHYARDGDETMTAILLKYLDPSLQKWGPDGYGDGHLIGDRGLSPHRRKFGWSGYVFETYTSRPRKDFEVLPGDRVYPSYCSYVNSIGSVLPDRTYQDWPRRDVVKAFREIGSSSQHFYSKHGWLGVSIPGSESVNLIKVYVLSSKIR